MVDDDMQYAVPTCLSLKYWKAKAVSNSKCVTEGTACCILPACRGTSCWKSTSGMFAPLICMRSVMEAMCGLHVIDMLKWLVMFGIVDRRLQLQCLGLHKLSQQQSTWCRVLCVAETASRCLQLQRWWTPCPLCQQHGLLSKPYVGHQGRIEAGALQPVMQDQSQNGLIILSAFRWPHHRLPD